MKKSIQKIAYCSPKIEQIKLDNEISLVLQSAENPMGDPDWSKVYSLPDSNPFKTIVS